MDYLFLFFCLIIDIITVYFTYELKKTWNKSNLNTNFVNIIYYILQFRFVFFGLIVSLLRIISEGDVLKEYSVETEELFYVYLIEFISNLIFLLIFTYFIKFIKKKSKIKNYNEQNLLFILSLFSFNFLLILLLPGYFTNLYGFLFTAFYNYGAISAIFLLAISIKKKKKLLFLLSLTCILIFFGKSIISGLRGGVVGVVVLFTILSYTTFSYKFFKKIVIFSFLFSVVFYQINTKLSSIKYEFVVAYANNKFDFSTIQGNVDFISDYLTEKYETEKSQKNLTSSFLKEYEFRFGASSMFAVGFLRLAQKNQYAYFAPLLNGFYSFLPKTLIDFDKPVSGSKDGSLESTGMYLSISEITKTKHNMTDFLVGPHYLWELGLSGIIIYSVLSGFSFFIIVRWLESYGLLGLSFLILMSKPFWFQFKLWPSEIITLLITNLIPVLVIVKFLLFLTKRKIILSKT